MIAYAARGVLRSEGFPYALDNGAWTAFQGCADLGLETWSCYAPRAPYSPCGSCAGCLRSVRAEVTRG